MDDDDGVDVDQILEEMPAWEKALKGESVEEVATQSIMEVLDREESYADKLDGTVCMQEVEDLIFEKGIDFEVFYDELKKHCTLAMFYN